MSEPQGRIDQFRTPRATCLLAPNPSPMTLDGTNTWLIAEPGSSSVVVVDPGPDDEGHLRRVHAEAVAGDRRVVTILLTHGHRDHSAGAARLAGLTGAPVQAADPARRLGPEGLADGDMIAAAGCELRVVATPGHSADSVCLLLPADGALFTGDTVLGRGTTVIATDGNLGDYLRTLDQLRELAEAQGVGLLLPGHGPMLADPVRDAGLLPVAPGGTPGPGPVGPRRGREDARRDRGHDLYRCRPVGLAGRRMVGPRPARLPERPRTMIMASLGK